MLSKIPEFKTEKEEAEFWDTHSIADFIDVLEEVEEIDDNNKSILSELQSQKEHILNIVKKYGAYNVRVFGSVSRGEENDKSDIDFLVDFVQGSSLIDLIKVKQVLEDLLGRKVDVVTEKALHPLVRQKVLQEAVPL